MPDRQDPSPPRVAERLFDPRVLRVTSRAPHAYLAVETARGPHVTPLLFALTPTRLWFVMARTTLKARVLHRRPRVGILIDDGASALVMGGDASVLDPLRPRDLAARLSELARAPLGISSYGLHNPMELMTFARDAARAPGEAPPPNLALVSIRPGPIEIVASLSSSRRAEPELDAAGGSPGGWREALAGVPDEPATLALRSGSAVLGWMTPRGPLAVPALWEPDRTACRVAGPVLARAGAPSEGPACVCVDATHGKGPGAKHGVLLRGRGRIDDEGDAVSVAIEPDRVTYWTGFETGTVAVAAAPS